MKKTPVKTSRELKQIQKAPLVTPTDLKPAATHLLDELRVPRAVAAKQQIATEELVRFAVQSVCDAVGEKSDARQARDRDHDREPEQVEFAGAQVAQHHAEGKPERFHQDPEGGRTGRQRAGASVRRTSSTQYATPVEMISSLKS